MGPPYLARRGRPVRAGLALPLLSSCKRFKFVLQEPAATSNTCSSAVEKSPFSMAKQQDGGQVGETSHGPRMRGVEEGAEGATTSSPYDRSEGGLRGRRRPFSQSFQKNRQAVVQLPDVRP